MILFQPIADEFHPHNVFQREEFKMVQTLLIVDPGMVKDKIDDGNFKTFEKFLTPEKLENFNMENFKSRQMEKRSNSTRPKPLSV